MYIAGLRLFLFYKADASYTYLNNFYPFGV